MQNEWKRMLYLGHGLGIAGKINGVRSASPSKQTRNVYNNYYFSNDSFDNSVQNEQSYEGPEYEEVDDADYSQDQEQQYLEDDQISYDQGNDWEWQQEQQQTAR